MDFLLDNNLLKDSQHRFMLNQLTTTILLESMDFLLLLSPLAFLLYMNNIVEEILAEISCKALADDTKSAYIVNDKKIAMIYKQL